MSVCFKIADTLEELEQLHHINWRVYAAELGQESAPEGARRLVDHKLDETLWIIAVVDDEVVGMVGLVEPWSTFSVETSLSTPIEPTLRARAVEVRRLAVLPEHRGHGLFSGLVAVIKVWAASHGYNAAVMSGLWSMRDCYRRLGFIDFGEPFTKGAARYQPMLLDLEDPAAEERRCLA